MEIDRFFIDERLCVNFSFCDKVDGICRLSGVVVTENRYSSPDCASDKPSLT